GVYKSGFATTQKAYENNVIPLFESLDRLEKLLDGGKEFIAGSQLTEADVRLFTTIVSRFFYVLLLMLPTCLQLAVVPLQIRFDPVYYSHFKTALGSIRHNYPNLNRWCKNLYWNYPAFKDTTSFEHIKASLHSPSTDNRCTTTPVTLPAGPLPHIEKL
ncbi:hypothetical protein JCM1841_006618, partial [Sporobolomyces salmonicolor]